MSRIGDFLQGAGGPQVECGHIPVGSMASGMSVDLPYVAVRGAERGKTLWINGQVHGDEINGMIASLRFARALEPKKMRGNVVVTPTANPHALATLQLHYLRWVLFDIGSDKYFMYQGIFDTDFDKYTEDAVELFKATGVDTVFENLEDFPMDWKTNPTAFVEFVRKHQCQSFLEYGEYPYVSADEIKKALTLKASFSQMLDQMQ